MFGRQDSVDDNQSNNQPAEPGFDATTSSTPPAPITEPSSDNTPSSYNPSLGKPVDDVNSSSAPADDNDEASEPNNDSSSDLPVVPTSSSSPFASGFDASDNEKGDEPEAAPASDSPVDSSDDLIDIKQQALQQLSPLLDQLDQSPEEKFRTTMMMIQAADNQSLIKDAYESAEQITDEKVKAQALLDIVNEINYFTHQHED
jgi:hypothetical protein